MSYAEELSVYFNIPSDHIAIIITYYFFFVNNPVTINAFIEILRRIILKVNIFFFMAVIYEFLLLGIKYSLAIACV